MANCREWPGLAAMNAITFTEELKIYYLRKNSRRQKLLKWEQRKANTAVMAIRKAEKSLWFYFFKLWCSINTYKNQQTKFFFRLSNQQATAIFSR